MGQGLDYNIGLSNLALMSLPANIIILILPFYKALADRLGRRLFLFINTIGMGMGSDVYWYNRCLHLHHVHFRHG